jgi:hypothetical protein
VADDVRQRLLDHPVGGQRHPVRQRRQIPGRPHVDRDPGGRHRGGQLGQVTEPVHRTELRPCLALLAQDSDQSAHLTERAAGGVLDDFKRSPLGLRVGAHGEPAGPGVHGHDAHAVRDDVVQLACDPDPFRRHRVPRELLAGLLQLTYPCLVFPGKGLPAANDVAEEPRRRDQADEQRQ